MNIEIIGDVCIDQNTSEHASYTAAGSPAMFMDRIFKQLPDCRVGIVASYGPDFKPFLSGISIYPKGPNLDKTEIHKNTSRFGSRVTIALNQKGVVPVELTPELINIIGKADVIFIAPLSASLDPIHLSNIIKYAKQGVLKVLLPQGYYRDLDEKNVQIEREFMEASSILPQVDLVIVSEQDHSNMEEIVKSWSLDYNIISAVTLGEKGAVVFEKGEEIKIPTTPVPEDEIVDTIGSGDIFSAGFAYRYKETENIKESGRFANELARQALFYPADKIKIDFDLLK